MLSCFQKTWAVNDSAGRKSLILGTLPFFLFVVGAVVGFALSIWDDWQDDGQFTVNSVFMIFVLAIRLDRYAAEGKNARR